MRKLSAVAALFLCAGCASGPPEWVASPSVEGGFAATDCVRDSGKLSLDRQVALAKARAGIARQFDQRVKALDQAYARLKEPDPAAPPGAATPFATASKPVAEQMLSGLPPVRVEYVEVDDVRSLCAMVTLEPEQMRPLFDRLLQASGETPDEVTREALYKDFSGNFASDAAP